MHETDDVELPLLTRAEADLTPGDQFSAPLPSQPRQAPGALPVANVQAVASQGPGSVTMDSSTGQPMTDLSGEALMRALLLEQRATNTALQSQLSVLSASVESIEACPPGLSDPARLQDLPKFIMTRMLVTRTHRVLVRVVDRITALGRIFAPIHHMIAGLCPVHNNGVTVPSLPSVDGHDLGHVDVIMLTDALVVSPPCVATVARDLAPGAVPVSV
ncbi:hypothetical protein PF008_g32766, partial [Phytophthora fragariae]